MRRPLTLPVLPLLLGALCFAASLTPSLVPRSWPVQGAIGGIVLALGYLVGRALLTLWHALELPVLRGRAAGVLHFLLALATAAVVGMCLGRARAWQNGILAGMDAPPLETVATPKMLVLAVLVAAILFALGLLVQQGFDRLRRRLDRVMPRRTANVAGLLVVAVALFVVTRDGVIDGLIGALDKTYTTAQDLFDTAPPEPAALREGPRAQSLVDWEGMGQPGRNFIAGGPREAAIAAFTGGPALDPVRVYVGLANADTAQARADMAVAELERQGGFQRKVLIVAMPTGTGWLDPGSFDVVEYMHRGDIATVAVQYSYLQSPFALLFETRSGLEQARALISAVHRRWREIPPAQRPRLYVHGLSLGAWASMYGTDLSALLDEPISGAFWAGPPFPSARWAEAMGERNPGSPWVAPEVGEGRLIRFASATRRAGGPTGWGSMRIAFLQYSSDPIVFYEPGSLLRAPQWMREPPAPDVSPQLRFTPLVTQFQLVGDMLVANSAPPGHGHAYIARDYIGPWVAVTAPEGWSDADSARLAAHCDTGFQQGCLNG